MSTTIEAVYEQGVLRLSRPIDLADGTRVDVIVIASHPALTPVMPDEPGPRKRTPAETMSDIAQCRWNRARTVFRARTMIRFFRLSSPPAGR